MVATDAAVLIPLRSFDDAKTRLAGVLSPPIVGALRWRWRNGSSERHEIFQFTS